MISRLKLLWPILLLAILVLVTPRTILLAQSDNTPPKVYTTSSADAFEARYASITDRRADHTERFGVAYRGWEDRCKGGLADIDDGELTLDVTGTRSVACAGKQFEPSSSQLLEMEVRGLDEGVEAVGLIFNQDRGAMVFDMFTLESSGAFVLQRSDGSNSRVLYEGALPDRLIWDEDHRLSVLHSGDVAVVFLDGKVLAVVADDFQPTGGDVGFIAAGSALSETGSANFDNLRIWELTDKEIGEIADIALKEEPIAQLGKGAPLPSGSQTSEDPDLITTGVPLALPPAVPTPDPDSTPTPEGLPVAENEIYDLFASASAGHCSMVTDYSARTAYTVECKWQDPSGEGVKVQYDQFVDANIKAARLQQVFGNTEPSVGWEWDNGCVAAFTLLADSPLKLAVADIVDTPYVVWVFSEDVSAEELYAWWEKTPAMREIYTSATCD